jgi:SAM-dependent methyltransferase
MDPTRIEAFAAQVVGDLAAAMGSAMTSLGGKLGFYRALGAAPRTPDELAAATGTEPRLVREWLASQRAASYVELDGASGRFVLPSEHAFVLAQPDSPALLTPAFDVTSAIWRGEDQLVESFRTGSGVGWHQHDHRLFSGTEAFFRNGYRANLVSHWIPALGDRAAALAAGGRAADVGCGHGASAILLAQAFPAARLVGIDAHAASIATARERAAEAGVADRVRFEVAPAAALPEVAGGALDLVCFMDAFHDFGDPVAAARAARAALADDGAVLLVEPFAHDAAEANVGPVARMYYAASTALCTQNALHQGGRDGLGAQAGFAAVAERLHAGGFERVRVAAQTPFNLVIEARP